MSEAKQLSADLSALAAHGHEDGITFRLSIFSGDYRFDWKGDHRVWAYSRFSDSGHASGEPLWIATAKNGEFTPGFVSTAIIEQVALSSPNREGQ
jgi:hypothetical protein